MKISDVKLYKLAGRHDAGQFAGEARGVGPLDVYETFRNGKRRSGKPAEAPVAIEAIYVEIETDDGVSGLYGPILREQAFVITSKLRRFLVGRDPLCGEALWDQMARSDRHARSGLIMMAISAVDCALWDLRGKFYGQPVYRLLGGPTRDRIPAYASMLGYSLEPRRVRERAKEFAGRGFAAQKWFFGHGPGSGAPGREANLELARTLREATGEGYKLMFDCWMGLDLPYAVDLARCLMEYNPTWLEEPLGPNHLEGFVRLKRETGIPLAAGEHLYTRWDVKPFLDAGALDYVQADPDWTGGITELVKICDMAATYDVPVVPHGHNLHGALHVIASRSPQSCPMAEYLIHHLPRQQFFHEHVIEPVDGFIELPAGPGLGFALDESKIEQKLELDWK